MTPSSLTPGLHVGPYALEQRLDLSGTGGEEVWTATHRLLERSVVLKMLPTGDKGQRARMRQEARLHARMTHPGVVPLLDIGEHEDRLYVALAHVDGRLLRQVLSSGEAVSVQAALAMMATVAAALDHAHALGVVHRDVGPDSILVGSDGAAHLTDFGIAAQADGDPLGRDGLVLGTPAYMAPEQVRGQAVTGSADRWALAATFCEVIVGEPLFSGRPREVLASISRGDLELGPLRARVPRYVAQIFERCLEVDPDRRLDDTALGHSLAVARERLQLESLGRDELETLDPGLTLTITPDDGGKGTGPAKNYRLEELLGAGAFGRVFRAHDLDSGRDVALKFLRDERLSDPGAVIRFRREARLLAQLDHPSVVRVYDFGPWGTTWFIAMEIIQGPNLRERAQREAPFALGPLASLMAPALEGLARVHAAGAVHRDIKPDNIGLVGERAVLLDFGLASTEEGTRATATGDVLGTALYMSPEQVGAEGVGPKSDVYSMGTVLYFLLSGRHPHEHEDFLPLLMMIAVQDPTPLATHRPDLPDGALSLVASMLARDPAARPTADEAARMLQAFAR